MPDRELVSGARQPEDAQFEAGLRPRSLADFAGQKKLLASFKLRSNPASPASVVLEGLRRIAAKRAEVVHGSTVATNALLERKGAKTAFVTTRGFEDLIAIGRQNRPELYNLTPALAVALVPRNLCFGVDERVLFDGSIERELRNEDIGDLARRIAESGVESVA